MYMAPGPTEVSNSICFPRFLIALYPPANCDSLFKKLFIESKGVNNDSRRKRLSLISVSSQDMKHLATGPSLFIASVAIIFMKTTAQHQQLLHRGPEHKHANFVEHPHAILNASVIFSTKVDNLMTCAFNCLKNSHCNSYNAAVSPDGNNEYECQLLATDKYNSSSKLRPSKEFNHYSIQVRSLITVPLSKNILTS